MASPYTTDQLVATTKLLTYLPTGSGLTDSQVLAVLTEQQNTMVMAFLKSIREEYVIATHDIAVTTSSTIPIPNRAAGGALRNIQWVNSASDVRQLPRIEPERVPDYGASANEPTGYVFQGNSVVLVPSVSSTTAGTLRLAYQQRLGQLVLPDACGLVTDVSGANVTISALPSTFTASSLYDLVRGTPNFSATIDQSLVSISQSGGVGGKPLLVFTTAPVLAVGDFVCLAGQSCIPQLPPEVHSLLAQAAGAKIAQATGSDRYPNIAEGLKDTKAELTILLSARSESSARPIVSKSSLGRNVLGRRR